MDNGIVYLAAQLSLTVPSFIAIMDLKDLCLI